MKKHLPFLFGLALLLCVPVVCLGLAAKLAEDSPARREAVARSNAADARKILLYLSTGRLEMQGQMAHDAKRRLEEIEKR